MKTIGQKLSSTKLNHNVGTTSSMHWIPKGYTKQSGRLIQNLNVYNININILWNCILQFRKLSYYRILNYWTPTTIVICKWSIGWRCALKAIPGEFCFKAITSLLCFKAIPSLFCFKAIPCDKTWNQLVNLETYTS